MSPLTLTLELLLVGLLMACLFFFWRLDRKLKALRDGTDGVRAAAAELAMATAQAEAAVKALRHSAADAGRDLQARISDARSTAERLGLGAGRMRSVADAAAAQVRRA